MFRYLTILPNERTDFIVPVLFGSLKKSIKFFCKIFFLKITFVRICIWPKFGLTTGSSRKSSYSICQSISYKPRNEISVTNNKRLTKKHLFKIKI